MPGTNKIKIAFFDTKPYDIDSFDRVKKDFGFKTTYFKGHLTPETAPLTRGFQVVCIFVNDVIDKNMVDILVKNGVHLIALRAAGYNNIDLKSCFKRITVVRVPAYSPYAVAEFAVALMLSLNRKVHKAYYRTRDNNFTLNGLTGFDMHGKTVGIIGTGKIGKAAISILNGFGMRVLAYDVFKDREFQQKMGFAYVRLNELYRGSDIISLHCPLTKDSYHLIDKTAISQMRRGVMIINTGRGLLINSKALIDGLKTGKVGFAGLDVYEEESGYFGEDYSNKVITDDVLARLISFNNVIVSSHQGFFTQEALHGIATSTMQNIQDCIEQRKIVNEIRYQPN